MFKTTLLLFIAFIFFSTQTQAKEQSAPNYEFKGQRFQLLPINDWSKIIKEKKRSSEIKHIDLSSYPKNLNLKEKQSPVKTQGQRGSCTFFATAALIEGSLKTKFGQEVNISEEYMAYHTKFSLNNLPNSDGSFIYYNILSIVDFGVTQETDVPFNSSWFEKDLPCEKYKNSTEEIPTFCFSHTISEPASERIIKFDQENGGFGGFAPDEEQLRSELIIEEMNKTGLPMSAEVPVVANLWNGETGEAGFSDKDFQACANKEIECGGHAIVLVGYDIDRKIFYFKNSWGEGWGEKGYGTISFDYINSYFYYPYTLFFNPKIAPVIPELSITKSSLENFSLEINQFDQEGIDVNSIGILKAAPHTIATVSVYLLTTSTNSDEYKVIHDKNGNALYKVLTNKIIPSTGTLDLSTINLRDAFKFDDIPESMRQAPIFYYMSIFTTGDDGYNIVGQQLGKIP